VPAVATDGIGTKRGGGRVGETLLQAAPKGKPGSSIRPPMEKKEIVDLLNGQEKECGRKNDEEFGGDNDDSIHPSVPEGESWKQGGK